MTPLPKRRHSSKRQGTRERIALHSVLTALTRCSKCKSPKRPHHKCPKCGFYK